MSIGELAKRKTKRRVVPVTIEIPAQMTKRDLVSAIKECAEANGLTWASVKTMNGYVGSFEIEELSESLRIFHRQGNVEGLVSMDPSEKQPDADIKKISREYLRLVRTYARWEVGQGVRMKETDDPIAFRKVVKRVLHELGGGYPVNQENEGKNVRFATTSNFDIYGMPAIGIPIFIDMGFDRGKITYVDVGAIALAKRAEKLGSEILVGTEARAVSLYVVEELRYKINQTLH